MPCAECKKKKKKKKKKNNLSSFLELKKFSDENCLTLFYYCRTAGMLFRDLKLFCRLRTGRVL